MKSNISLQKILKRLNSEVEIRKFLLDVCSPAELDALEERWKVAQLLDEGWPYRKIYEKTGVSTATVTRVARALKGQTGGYRLALTKRGAP